jgi:uncharacterized membrane protein (UPF0127 family)
MYITVNNNMISKNAKFCNGICKFVGLMFARKLRNDDALILVNASDIHMLFVFQSIDVVWLDKNKIVIDKKEDIKPFNISISPKFKAYYVIELPLGKAKLFKLKNKVNLR